ncbi:MAG: YvcK family protein [Hydrogenobacter thermophilus]|uniref:gluconeogenesis factor YvcK family protein n=1 Tax=Hydrogenobacter thermophilus TaxID=940 RepID=UPI001C76ABE5|nr:YvcK family protein [Hydrogenobacter thermophilus]QWK20253.1 MAG: YvcK family protein [Hydrogenobacter thermophilus]
MNIVAIGGGTGLSSLLRGLKKEVGERVKSLSAIVTVTDSGGSTGRLRKAYNLPAPGDIRNCIVALSESEQIMQQLFQYRFKGGELEGHAFGNLFLIALTDITGSFMMSIKIASQILRTKGDIIPATVGDVHLCAEFSDGKVVMGEEEITNYGKENKVRIKRIWIQPEDTLTPIDAVGRIESADMITFGPGSLYTSIIPNLLIKDIREAVERSNALKVFIVNAMTQPGETDGFTAYDHLMTFLKHSGIKKVDAVIVNTKMPSSSILKRYLDEGQEPVVTDIARIAREGFNVYAEDLIGDKEDFVRHDPDRLADLLMRVYYNYAVLP